MNRPPAKTLVMICGPPAVGKMTVGIELGRRTGFPLFHNHLSIEAILPVFPFGSPAFHRLVGGLRDQVFAEVAASDLDGLIFTLMWAFDLESEQRGVERVMEVFREVGGRTVFVELEADLSARLERNSSELRLQAKASKRDVEASQERLLAAEEKWQLNSNGDFPFEDHIKIDNTNLSPSEVADLVVERFGLPH